jgi:hypothetical protein
MTGKELIAHLADYCETDGNRIALATPFTVMFADGPHTIATNGLVLMDVIGEHGFPAYSAEDPKVGANVTPIIDALKTADPVPVDIGALRSFVGVVDTAEPNKCETCDGEEEIECPECDGDCFDDCECDCGNVHERSCEKCKGEGTVACPNCDPVPPDDDHVRIGARRFRRAILYYAFRYLPNETALWHEGGEGRASVLTGDGWRLLLMPMREFDQPVLPTFALSEASHVA